MLRPARVLALMLLLPAAVACGGGGSDDASTAGSSSSPACSDVWMVGKTLPKTYEGCVANGDEQAYMEYGDCTDGRKFIGYAPDGGQAYFAGLGGEIGKGSVDDAAWSAALAECTGESAN
ncbi:hypothetical protein [Aeromicrobium sp. Root495]|uniref:hypothetical protein n=1 Tax=Aeromicrobium sp. Root495 TaxID=1736550 RepID=UPI0012E71319|nr:hypothetical protein [Aeromicrobium sp. Root495]